MFESIARDEAEHASVSLAVAVWITPQLSPAEQAQVKNAARQALAELYTELRIEPEAGVITLAGVPNAAQARALLHGVEQQLMAA